MLPVYCTWYGGRLRLCYAATAVARLRGILSSSSPLRGDDRMRLV